MEKQIVTSNRSLTDETERLLNEQIGLEGLSSSYYLAMASWCDKSGYATSADFLYRHTEEERQHMLRLFHYVNDAGGHAIHPDITDVKYDYKIPKVIAAKSDIEIHCNTDVSVAAISAGFDLTLVDD